MTRRWKCAHCGMEHDEVPEVLGLIKPDAYFAVPELERRSRCLIDEDRCVIDHRICYLRCDLELPVLGRSKPLVLGVWCELSVSYFRRTLQLWEAAGREAEPPYPATLASSVPTYPPTLGLPGMIVTRPVPRRPAVLLGKVDHLLYAEQTAGISEARMLELGTAFLHG